MIRGTPFPISRSKIIELPTEFRIVAETSSFDDESMEGPIVVPMCEFPNLDNRTSFLLDDVVELNRAAITVYGRFSFLHAFDVGLPCGVSPAEINVVALIDSPAYITRETIYLYGPFEVDYRENTRCSEGSLLEENIALIGRRIREVRKARGLSQQGLADLTGIATPQLSSYETGKKAPSLFTIAKLSTALETSIDYLYFGSPSEAFINQSADFGETVVNCFRKLYELGVIDGVSTSVGAPGGVVILKKCEYELSCLSRSLLEFVEKSKYLPDASSYLEQLYGAAVNQIDQRYEL